MINNKEILFFKHCGGETTPEEDIKVQEMLACSEENRKEMESVMAITSLEKQIEELSHHDTDKGYERMMTKVRKYETRKRTGKFILNACAALALPLMVSVSVLAYKNIALKEQLDYTCWQTVSAAPGTVATVELPDRSRVWLNSGSTISYPNSFRNKDRTVKIDGEAYFDVQSDSRHPFCVETREGLTVMAHGTRFNVSAYSNDNEIETALENGAVSLMVDGEVKCQLEPGESGIFSRKHNILKIKQVNIIEKTAWTQGRIIFRNASLEEVFDRLGRKYNIDFTFHDSDNLSGQYRCRITFQDETIQQVMGYLQMAAPIRYENHAPVIQDGDILEKQKIEVWLEKQ